MRVLGADARGAVVGVEGLGDGAVDCGEVGWGVSEVRPCLRWRGCVKEEGEDEPKGRWIWTPLRRSFLVNLGKGMLGGGCGGNAEGGNVWVFYGFLTGAESVLTLTRFVPAGAGISQEK